MFKGKFSFGPSDESELERFRRDLIYYVKSTSARVGPVPFGKVGALFGKRAKKLGLAISEYMENDPAFVVSHPTQYSRAVMLSEGLTVGERIMGIVSEEHALPYEHLINLIMDKGIPRSEIVEAIETLHKVGAVIHEPYLNFGDTVRIVD